MRKFSIKEQEDIRRLVFHAKSSLSYVLINVYNDVFYQKKVEYNKGQLVFYVHDMASISTDIILAIEKDIIDTSFLIEYLKVNRYIYLIDDNSTGDELKSVGGFIKDGLIAISKDLDKRASSILDEAMNRRVFVSNDLVQLVVDNFKTIEDQALEESREQTRLSRNSFVLAMIALAISVIVPIVTAFFSSNEVSISKPQFEQIINSVNSGSLTDTIIGDTVQVDNVDTAIVK